MLYYIHYKWQYILKQEKEERSERKELYFLFTSETTKKQLERKYLHREVSTVKKWDIRELSAKFHSANDTKLHMFLRCHRSGNIYMHTLHESYTRKIVRIFCFCILFHIKENAFLPMLFFFSRGVSLAFFLQMYNNTNKKYIYLFCWDSEILKRIELFIFWTWQQNISNCP